MKKIDTKTIFLLIVIALIPSGYIFSITNPINFPKDTRDDTNVIEKKEDNYDSFIPTLSLPNWSIATKHITSGSQVDPPFDADNIKWDDDLVDDTMFSPGYDDLVARDYAVGVTTATGAWGTTDKGLWVWSDAYRYNDGKYLFLESTWGNNYPGWINMAWGPFQDIPAGSHQHVRQIRIPYEIWADSFAGVLDQSLYLSIAAYDDQLHYEAQVIAPIPVDDHHYIGIWTLTSGVLFDRVKAGGYISHLVVTMWVNEEIWTYTWINVDFAYIIYDYEMPDLDLYYELDYGGLGLTTITQFELNIGADECIDQTNVYLYNYDNSSWVPLGITLTTPGLYTTSISSKADEYFSPSKIIAIAFTRYNYYDDLDPPPYHLKIDFIRIEIPPPEPPSTVYVNQEILHILLTWDPSETYGAPVTEYNIYRGEVENGSKTLLGTTPTTEYNDSDVTVGVRYYYFISASSVSGESANSSEVSGQAYDHPFVEWLTPTENKSVVFPKGEPVTFHFTYDWTELDDVELVIEKGMLSVNHGSVWNKTSIDIYEGSYIDGYVNATLFGYNQSILVASHSSFFTFVKIVLEVTSTLNSSTEIVGKQLYLILHDPHGDNSHSTFSDETTLSFGVGSEVSVSTGTSLTLGYFYEEQYSQMEFGASTLLESKTTAEFGFDFRYEVSDSTTLTSMQVTDDQDYIGPGYGDRYWGESWIYKWVLNATYRGYSNGTYQNEDPKIYYGIIRGAETYCSDAVAPPEWRSQNAVYNNSIPVNWMKWFMESGGAPYLYEHAVTTTETRTVSLQFDLGFAFRTAFGVGESTTTVELSVKNYFEEGLAHTHKVAYEINDDEPTDFIVQGVGMDERFGTFIFNTSSFFSETSGPYEHGTYDYLPPEINFPEIDLDTDDDGFGPTSDDSPFVEVDIFEEDAVQEAIIWYSINNGTDWQFIFLSEYPADPGTWYGTIPAQPFNTTVLWYVQVWDNQGNNGTRYDSFGSPFEYRVVSLPSDAPPGIHGFPLVSIIPITIVAIIAITVIYYRKRKT